MPLQFEGLTDESFAAGKAAGRFKHGQVPVLERDGEQLCQSGALLVWAGKLAGLPATWRRARHVPRPVSVRPACRRARARVPRRV